MFNDNFQAARRHIQRAGCYAGVNICQLLSVHVHHCSTHWECFEHMECPKLHFRRLTRLLSWLRCSTPPVPGGVSRLHLIDRGLKPSLVVPRDVDSVMPINHQ